MKDILEKIGKEIYSVAKLENSFLEPLDQGIFFVPELAFAYLCGRSIINNKEIIFGSIDVNWKREENIGSGGPTDIILELSNGKCIAIEFKLRDKASAYIKDLAKLSRLPSENYVRLFCVLIDTFTESLPCDGRLSQIESFAGAKIEPIFKPEPFPTKQNWYVKDVSCVMGLWEISNV